MKKAYLLLLIILLIGCNRQPVDEISLNDNTKQITSLKEVFSKDNSIRLSSTFEGCEINLGEVVTAVITLENMTDFSYDFYSDMNGTVIYADFVTSDMYGMLAYNLISAGYILEAGHNIRRTLKFTPDKAGKYFFYAQVKFINENGESEIIQLDTQELIVLDRKIYNV